MIGEWRWLYNDWRMAMIVLTVWKASHQKATDVWGLWTGGCGECLGIWRPCWLVNPVHVKERKEWRWTLNYCNLSLRIIAMTATIITRRREEPCFFSAFACSSTLLRGRSLTIITNRFSSTDDTIVINVFIIIAIVVICSVIIKIDISCWFLEAADAKVWRRKGGGGKKEDIHV